MSFVKSIAQAVRPAEDTNIAMCSIADYPVKGQEVFGKALALQYFPESIRLNKTTDYATKKPIGGSHPIYQWITGGERTLSFDTIFTAEVDAWKEDQQTSLLNSAEAVAQRVGNFLKNPLSSISSSALQGQPDYGANHVDIAAGVNWLMSKTYPSYGNNKQAIPPPRLELYLPNSGINTYIQGVSLQDTFFCIMTRMSVNYTSFFRSGAPRIAEISMDFDEIIQVGKQWGFVPRESFVYNKDTQAQAAKAGVRAQPVKYGYTKKDPKWKPGG